MRKHIHRNVHRHGRRYLIEQLDTRLLLAAPDLSPLAIDGLTETSLNSGVFVATNPTIKYGSTPVLSLQGSVSVNTTAITATGKVSTAIGSQTFTLFDGGFSIPVGQAVTNTLNDALPTLPNKLTLGGVSLAFSKFTLTSAGVKLDATASLPAALGAFTLNATDVTIGSGGISAATLAVASPQAFQFNLGGFKLNAQSLSAVYDVASSKTRLQGLFNAPQLNTTVDLSGQKFIAIGGDAATPTIDFNGGASIAGPVTIGGPWKLKSADLSVTYVNATFATSGSAVVDTGGGDVNLQASFANNAFSFSAAGAAQFQLLGMNLAVSAFTFTSDQAGGGTWDPKLTVKGSLSLPQQFGGITVSVDGANSLTVTSAGVTVTGGNVAFPGNQRFTLLGLLDVKSTNANLAFDFNQSEVKLTGAFTVPTLNDLAIDLTGSNFAALKFANAALDFAVVGSFANINIDIYQQWKLQNGQLTINKPYGAAGSVSGSFQIKTPNNTTIALALAFANGKLDQITVNNNNPNPDFTFFGVSASVTKLKFIPDINAGNADDFEPQLELQGSVKLPTSFGTANGGGVTFSVADPEKFVLNETSLTLTGGSISIPAVNFNLLNVVKVSVQNLNVQYISTPTAALRVSGVVKIPQLYNLTLDFNPAQNRYIQLDAAGALTVNGVISVQNVNIVPNVWVIKQATFAFNNTGQSNLFAVTAKLLIPGGFQIDGSIKFVNGDLDAISLAADNLNLPIGTTGVFLQRIGGGLENLVDPSSNTAPLKFTGELGLSIGNRITVDVSAIGGPSFTGSIVDLTVTGSIDKNKMVIAGRIAIVGDSRPVTPVGLITGTTSLTLNFKQKSFVGTANINFLDGTLQGDLTMTVGNGVFQLAGNGSANVPNFVFTPLGGRTLASATGVLFYNGNLTESYIKASGSLGILGNAGVNVPFSGLPSIFFGAVPVPDLSVTSTSRQGQFTAGNLGAKIVAGWSNLNTPASLSIEFVEPNGNTIDLTQPGNGAVAQTQFNVTQTASRTYLDVKLTTIQRTGTYRVTLVSQPGQNFGLVNWKFSSTNAPPTITLNNAVVANGRDVTINYSAADPDDQAAITFYYDKNNAGFQGTTFPVRYGGQNKAEVPELDQVDSALWRSQTNIPGGFYGVPSGTYFLYAQITDGKSVSRVYLPQPIVIVANANPHVEALFVDSSKWTQRFRDGLAARGLGGANGFQIFDQNNSPLSTRAMPWSNIDRLVVTISQPVEVPIDAITLAGVTSANYAVTADDQVYFSTITVTLDNNLTVAKRERLILRLSQTITDLIDGTAFDGGNTGNPGNPAVLPINVLAGDVDGDGTVNAADRTLFNAAFYTTADNLTGAYSPYADFDGSGAVNILDFAVLSGNTGQSLPAPLPRPAPTKFRPVRFSDDAIGPVERDSTTIQPIRDEVLR